MSTLILRVEDLHTSFFTRAGIARAVDGVNFFVRESETFGIVGESGCGKTVTGLSIIRLLPKPAGRIVGGKIMLDGTDLLQLSEKEMRSFRGSKISMILQDPMTSLNPVFTIGDQIAESIRLHQNLPESEIAPEVISSLRLLRIPAPEMVVHNYPFQLSGGMRQRVVGSIAMSCHPRILIADEPTTALDATIQAQYITLFQEVQQKTGVGIIYITHDFAVVAKVCHRVGVMYAGKIVETAPTIDLFKNPVHPYTLALINSVPRLERKDERLYSIEGQPPSLMNLPAGCRFRSRCPVTIAICQEQEPPEIEVGREHSVSCWKAQQ